MDFEIYTDKIGESGRIVIRRAYELTLPPTHQDELTPDHLLIAIAESESTLFEDLMVSLGLDAELVLEALSRRLPGNRRRISGARIAEPTRVVLANALERARLRGDWQIGSKDLFVAIFEDKQSNPNKAVSKARGRAQYSHRASGRPDSKTTGLTMR